jgi:CBS domain-containing protein
VKIGDLATTDIVSVAPADSLRAAAQAIVRAGVGSAVVLADGDLAGIITERDVLRAVAESSDLDHTATSAVMTCEVVTVGRDWEVYEAAAEMAARHIRHLVVTDAGRVVGVVSVRDVLLAGQRVPLTSGGWAVLRDPLTFTIRERRKLQRYLLGTRGADTEATMADLLGLLIGTWSLPLDLPPEEAALRSLSREDYAALREAVLLELPELQRAVHPSPGWRRR